MHISFNQLLFVCFTFLALSHLPHSAKGNQQELSAEELIKELQKGGHIIYMRHAKTNLNQKDIGEDRLDSCDKQRNLSDEGRTQAKEIGKSVSVLEIPIGQVISSPYCRCKDTAQLTFGKMKVNNDLQFSISKSEEESQFLGNRLKNLMLEANTADGNVVFVGHTSNLRDGLGVWPKPEGVIVVFKNVGGEIIYKGMIKPTEITESP